MADELVKKKGGNGYTERSIIFEALYLFIFHATNTNRIHGNQIFVDHIEIKAFEQDISCKQSKKIAWMKM